jgi:hypothetical protein
VATATLWAAVLVAELAVPAAIKAAQITQWVQFKLLPLAAAVALTTALVAALLLKLA